MQPNPYIVNVNIPFAEEFARVISENVASATGRESADVLLTIRQWYHDVNTSNAERRSFNSDNNFRSDMQSWMINDILAEQNSRDNTNDDSSDSDWSHTTHSSDEY